jgi:protein phosphatase 1 regulatory subunit 7
MKTLEDYFRNNNYSLKTQKELTIIYCHNEKLTSLEGIENCINLEKLYCNNNKLTSLKGIENCPNLEILDCEKNQLTSLIEIENCPDLKNIFCDDLEDINQYKDKIENMNIYL